MSIVPEVSYLKEKLLQISSISSYGLVTTATVNDLLCSSWKTELCECERLSKILDDTILSQLHQGINECLKFIEEEYSFLFKKLELSKDKVGDKSLTLLEFYRESLSSCKSAFLFKWSGVTKQLFYRFKDYRHNNITEVEIERWLMQFSDDAERN